MDKGPWKVFSLAALISDDFEHDVMLHIDGDFANDEELRAYAEWLVSVLNKAAP